MKRKQREGKIVISPKRSPWPHELHTAKILALAGHKIEFLSENSLHSADILLDGVEFEMKAPETAKISSVEQLIRKALKQSPNIIIDSFRVKIRDDKIKNFLVKKCKEQKQIKKMLFITKTGKIIDIFSLF